ncbi:MAG: LptF/LptG family permease, partial [Candidatus Sumerlaeota bacterium]|nr:LptF/LptG family permease [Candidatus Sumerlaeota bacterium]
DPKTGDLEGVTMKVGNSEKSSMPNSVVFISAPRGRVIPKPDEAAIHVILDDGTLHFQSFAPERADEYDIANFKHLSRETIMNLGRRNEDGTFRPTERQRSVAELKQIVSQAEAARKSLGNLPARDMDKALAQMNENFRDRYVRRYRVEVAQRFSIPLACVAISLLAIPLAIYIRPSAKTLGFAIALGLTFTYYVLVQWGVKVGLSGSALGVPLIYAPNILLGGIGLALMIRTVRR